MDLLKQELLKKRQSLAESTGGRRVFKRANSELGAVKEKREFKKTTAGRSYAEVVREAQAVGSEESTLNGRDAKLLARTEDGLKAKLMKEKQASMVGDEKFTAVVEGKGVDAPACGGSGSACLLVPKTLQYPVNPGFEALRRRKEPVEVGSASLSQLGVRMELQELKSFLTKIKDDVELGIKRVEEAVDSLGLDGFKMGSGEGQSLGSEREAGFTKPKRKNRRRNKKKKNKKNPFGPKPGFTLVVGDDIIGHIESLVIESLKLDIFILITGFGCLDVDWLGKQGRHAPMWTSQ
ncbi:hypothetical protein FH972_006155 [Carpinus fangiana]|uniref:Uncharacterized protein n=1 Tax=Carpinus fangiana TaxID=176857 RepID=A0A5N6QRR6_9ROSI|nr:hypothetical protein FH972_006155 [Carpinus fangiana]